MNREKPGFINVEQIIAQVSLELVVAGPNDVIAIDALGGPAVALCGHEQAEKLGAFAQETGSVVTVMFDCTEEGELGGRLIRVGLSGSDTAPSPAWIKAADFQYGYYFSNVSGSKADFEVQVEGGEPVWISSVAAYAHPDAMYREFESGVVLANPSPRPYTFDLTGLLPGKRFRRFKGTPNQDLATNSGAAVAGQVTLGPKDALFLVKVDR